MTSKRVEMGGRFTYGGGVNDASPLLAVLAEGEDGVFAAVPHACG